MKRTFYFTKDSLPALVGKKVLICFRYRIKNMSIIGKLTSNSYTDYGGPYFVTNKYISIIFYREDVKEIYKTNKNITIII